MTINALGEKIRLSRLMSGLTQSELAKKIGASKNSISLIESGSHIPRGQMLAKLSKFFNIPIEQLLNLASGNANTTGLESYSQISTKEGDRVLPVTVIDGNIIILSPERKSDVLHLLSSALVFGIVLPIEIRDLIQQFESTTKKQPSAILPVELSNSKNKGKKLTAKELHSEEARRSLFGAKEKNAPKEKSTLK